MTTSIVSKSNGTQGALQVNGVDSVVFDGNGLILPSVNGGQIAGFRNRIINGDMRIDQRNFGTVYSTGTNSSIYVLDRFYAGYSLQSKYTVQQNSGAVAAPPGFSKYLGVVSTSAYSIVASDLYLISHAIEGQNITDFAWGTASAKPITLSFWVRSSLTGVFGGSIRNGTGSRSYPFTYTIISANTWEQKTITIPGDTTGTWATDNTAGMILTWGLGVGSTYSGTAGSWVPSNLVSTPGAVSVVSTNSATFYITGVQLELGSVATPFEQLPYGLELALCQRYFEKIGGQANADIYFLYGAPGSGYNQSFSIPTVYKRATPTVTIVGTWATGGSTLPTVISATNQMIIMTAQSTVANGQNGVWTTGTSTYVTSSAEL
jgi:hypothetical protein